MAEKGKLQLSRDVWKRLLQGTIPPSCLQSLIRSNQHHREKLQSRLISQNGASVMGNKWTTTVNCSSLLHALWLIQSQRETFLELQNHISFSLFWGNVWKLGALIALNDRMALKGEVCKVFFNFCHGLVVKITHTHLCQVAYCKHLAKVPSNPRPQRSWEMLT